MSDEDRDVDIESDDDDYDRGSTPTANSPGGKHGNHFQNQADKIAHHNALERKRRDHIKDSFSGLRDSVPALHGEKSSRAQILKKAADYIQLMRKKNSSHQHDIDDLKRQNKILEEQIRMLEKSRNIDNFAVSTVLESNKIKKEPISAFDGGSASDESSDTEDSDQSHRKRLKTNAASAVGV